MGSSLSSTCSSQCCGDTKSESEEEEKEQRRRWKKGRRREAESGGGEGHFRRSPDIREEELHRISGRMFLNGAGQVACLHTQQGRKGSNQDAMLVWEVSVALLAFDFAFAFMGSWVIIDY